MRRTRLKRMINQDNIRRRRLDDKAWEDPYIRDLYFGGALHEEALVQYDSDRRSLAKSWSVAGPPD